MNLSMTVEREPDKSKFLFYLVNNETMEYAALLLSEDADADRAGECWEALWKAHVKGMVP